MTWHLMNTGYHSGAFNMAFDEQLARNLLEKAGYPTLRCYAWRPFTLSIGFNQREEEFDRDRLTAEGIDLVRRPTGGRAILHAHELTYSVVMKCDEKSPKEIYRSISEGLLCGLSLLGIEAHVAGADDDLRKFYKDPSSIPCFASSTRHEIQYNGKKLIGSAQRRYRSVVLQHGSLLLGPQHRRITELMGTGAKHLASNIARELEAHTIEAETILRRPISFEEASSCITRGFEQAWNISFAAETSSPLEAGLQVYPSSIQHEMSVLQ